MSLAERDRSLVEHLATKVMGWHTGSGLSSAWFSERKDYPSTFVHWKENWNPLSGPNAGNDAMALWEKARAVYPEWGIKLETLAGGSRYDAYIWRPFEKDGKNILIQSSSATRAIAEAMALATGWEEPYA